MLDLRATYQAQQKSRVVPRENWTANDVIQAATPRAIGRSTCRRASRAEIAVVLAGFFFYPAVAAGQGYGEGLFFLLQAGRWLVFGLELVLLFVSQRRPRTVLTLALAVVLPALLVGSCFVDGGGIKWKHLFEDPSLDLWLYLLGWVFFVLIVLSCVTSLRRPHRS